MQMTDWPIGLSTGCFYRRSIFEVLPEIRASGFREIEVCSFPKHLDYHRQGDVHRAGEAMRSLDLHPFSFHAPFADHIDITSLDDLARDAAVNELLAACNAAAVMGVRHIVLHPGPERSGRPHPEEFLLRLEHAADSLNRVAKACCDLGLELLLENMLPHLLFGHTGDMLHLVGEITSCNVGTCLDTGHAYLAREITTVIHKLSGHLKMLHVNDNAGDRDSHLPPGDGGIDWPWVISELKRCEFRGSLILELSSGENEAVPDMLARATHARDYLARLACEAA